MKIRNTNQLSWVSWEPRSCHSCICNLRQLFLMLRMVSDQFLLIFSNATQFVQELHEGCVFRFFCHMLSKQFGANLPERNSSVFTPFEIFTPSPSIWLFSPSPSIWRFVNTELNRRLESGRGNQIDWLPIHSLLPIDSFNFSSRLWRKV